VRYCAILLLPSPPPPARLLRFTVTHTAFVLQPSAFAGLRGWLLLIRTFSLPPAVPFGSGYAAILPLPAVCLHWFTLPRYTPPLLCMTFSRNVAYRAVGCRFYRRRSAVGSHAVNTDCGYRLPRHTRSRCSRLMRFWFARYAVPAFAVRHCCHSLLPYPRADYTRWLRATRTLLPTPRHTVYALPFHSRRYAAGCAVGLPRAFRGPHCYSTHFILPFLVPHGS